MCRAKSRNFYSRWWCALLVFDFYIREGTSLNICLNMEVNKDAVCIVVVPKIGLVDIPGMPSKEAVLAEIYRKCRNSPKQSNTECKH